MSNGGLTNAFAFGGKIYAFYDFDIVYMSSDTAKSWHYFGSGYYSNSTTMGGNIYLVDNYYMKIYVSSDTGKNWRRCFPNTNPNKYINDIASDSSVLAAAIDKNGVIMSVDSGKNWVYINQGLTILDASSITIGKDYIYCSIGDRSIFRRPLRDAIISGIEKTSGAFCEQFNVNVYPNPLNQYTTFHFGRALEHGKIVVYNLTGKEIANCSNINGSSFQLQCSNLAGGTYIYLLMEGAKKLAGGKLQVK